MCVRERKRKVRKERQITNLINYDSGRLSFAFTDNYLLFLIRLERKKTKVADH